MAFKALLGQQTALFVVALLLGCLACTVLCETGDCGQQEFKDRSGNCALCRQCGPGMELSKECGFGYGEDAQCVGCRPHRFKEDWGFQKCKPCLDCALLSRFQKANCSATSDAVCGDCLPGFYRKTKLVGFQDMECVPCGDPPPPYEPHCTSRVNLVRIPSTASSPRDTALAAVICSALASVLVALVVLCVIYCKRQFMEKKPSWSLRAQDLQYTGSELSCFDRPRLGACAQCHRDSAQTRVCSSVNAYYLCNQNYVPRGEHDGSQSCVHAGPVHLIPSRCCDGACGIGQGTPGCWVHSRATLEDRSAAMGREAVPPSFGSLCGECVDAWPLMQSPGCDSDASSCDSRPDLPGEDADAPSPGSASVSSLDSDRCRDLGAGAVPLPVRPEHFAELSRHSSLPEPALTRAVATATSQPAQQTGDMGSQSAQMGLQDAERTCFFLQ